MVDNCKFIKERLEKSYYDMFSFIIYDDIDDDSSYKDVILIQFDCYSNDDIFEHMGAYSKSPNFNEKD